MKKIYFQRLATGWEIGLFGWCLEWKNIDLFTKRVIILMFSLMLFSCGSVDKFKENKKTKIDSLSQSNSSSNLNRWIDSDKYSLEPADLSQPMRFVNSKGEIKEYFNTKIIHQKEIIRESKKDTLANKTELKKEVEEEKKEVHRDNTMLILGVVGIVFGFLFMIIIFVVWRFEKKMSTIMQLLPKNT